MEASQRTLLRRNRIVLTRDLILEEVSQILVGENILNDRMVEVINSKPSTFDRNVVFLNKLPARGPCAFEAFYEALLDTDQRHLAAILDPGLPPNRRNGSRPLANITRLPHTPISPPSSFSFDTESTPSKDFGQSYSSTFEFSTIGAAAPRNCIPYPTTPKIINSTPRPNVMNRSPPTASVPSENNPARIPVEQMDVTPLGDNPRGESSPNILCASFESLRSNSSLESLQSAAGILPGNLLPFTANKNNHIPVTNFGNHISAQVLNQCALPSLVCDAPAWQNVQVKPSTAEFLQTHMHDCYPMFNARKGVALLVNVIKFEPSACLDDRLGGEIDSARLELMFRQLSYDVFKLISGTASEISNTLKNFAVWPKLKDYESCFIVLMSHGQDGAIFGRDGRRVILRDMFDLFSNKNCPHLQNKPKVFLIQACRGDQPDKGTDQIDAPNSKNNIYKVTKRRHLSFDEPESRNKLPNMSDCLFAYATVPGYTAMRNTHTGTWFIQAFIQIVAFHARDKSLHDIMTMTNNQVKGREGYSPDSEFYRCKEMSEFTSCLCKTFYFFPGI